MSKKTLNFFSNDAREKACRNNLISFSGECGNFKEFCTLAQFHSEPLSGHCFRMERYEERRGRKRGGGRPRRRGRRRGREDHKKKDKKTRSPSLLKSLFTR